MPQRQEHSAEKKGQIIGMADAGYSMRQIGDKLNIPFTTVGRVIKRFKETGSTKNLTRPGRPSLLTERDTNHLARISKLHRFMPLREITDNVPVNVSTETVRLALKKRGRKLYMAAKKPKITPKNVQQRKNWCQDVSKWSEEEWGKVIWSDESSVELGLSSRKVKVWRTIGERYKIDCLAPNMRSGRISVMFWACFWQNELGPLVALPDGRIDSSKYCEILEEHLFPFYTAVKETLGEEPWFMDDNCRVHNSNMTKAWKDNLGIRMLEWPSQSPDINPIENLWKLWKDGIEKARPQPTNREELITIAQKAWEKLQTTDIGQTLANSIKNRIAAVRIAKGQPTKY
jgi:transposase